MVDSDFKHGRVENPTAKLSKKQEKGVKEFVRAFFDKAVKKQKEAKANGTVQTGEESTDDKKSKEDAVTRDDAATKDDEADVQLSDNEVERDDDTPLSAVKRRRGDSEEAGLMEIDGASAKRSRISAENTPTPVEFDPSMIPPPPPPPPLDTTEDMAGTSDLQAESQTPNDVPAEDVMDIDTVETAGTKEGYAGHTSNGLATPPTTGSTNGVQEDGKGSQPDGR